MKPTATLVFLRAVFGEELSGARPVIVSFKGNPGTVPQRAWFGRPWQGIDDLTADLTADANNYFSLAVFKPDEAGIEDPGGRPAKAEGPSED